MHYRSHSEPSDWIRFDFEQLCAKFHAGCLRTAWNPHAVVTSGPQFGRLVQWQKSVAHRWDTCGYPAARLVLRAQLKLSEFLSGMEDSLLRSGVDQALFGRDQWDLITSTSYKSEVRLVADSVYSNQAFCAPPAFNSQRIFDICQMMHRAAEDELYHAQTDPGYIRYVFDEAAKLRLGSPSMQDTVQERIYMAPLELYCRESSWSFLLTMTARFGFIEQQHLDQIRPREELPKAYSNAIRDLEEVIAGEFHVGEQRVSKLISGNAQFQAWLVRRSAQGQPKRKKKKSRTAADDAFLEDPLYWNLQALSSSRVDGDHRDASFHIAFIDEILSFSSQKEKARLDSTIYSALSEVAALDEMLRMINCHKSRQPRSVWEPAQFKGNFSLGFQKIIPQAIQDCPSGEKRLLHASQLLQRLPDPRFKEPARKSLEEHKALHAALELYWQEMRSVVIEGATKPNDLSEQNAQIFAKYTSATLSAEYKVGVQEEQKILLKAIEEKDMCIANWRFRASLTMR